MVSTAYASGALLCLTSGILCLLTGSILLLYSGRKRPGLYLGLSYLAFGYAFVIAGLTYDHLIYYLPHLYRTGNICWLVCMPLSWLYIRTAITNKGLSAWDLLQLLPLALYLVDYSPFLFSSAAVKSAVIYSDINHMNRLIRYSQGWFLPENSQIPIRAVQSMFYWVWEVGLLASPAAAQMRKDRSWFRWILLYVGLQIPVFLPTMLALFTGIYQFLWASTIPPVAAGFLSALTLFLNPRILYGIRKAEAPPPARTRPLLDQEFIGKLTVQLEKVMRERMPFLDPDYTSKELADTIGVPLYKLSAYINQTMGTNFSEYLNQWRIRYCLDMVREKKLEHLNLHGIATKCGFNNRNTFSAAFKKVTGKPPSVYLHMNESPE